MSEHDQRRRMDFRDPVDIATAIMEVSGATAMLQAQTRDSLNNMTNSMQAMQAELRAIANRTDQVISLQQDQKHHGQGLERAFAAIAELAESVRSGFENVRTEQEEYRSRRERDESRWRAEHIKENQATRDKVIWFSGAAAMISLMASLFAGVVMYYTNKADQLQTADRQRVEDIANDTAARVRRMENYMSKTQSFDPK